MSRKRAMKLTPAMLRKMVLQERRRLHKRRLRETSDPIADGIEDPAYANAEEVDADDQADTLEKDIDYIKALKIEERKLRKTLRRISEAKKKLRRRINRKI